MSVCAIAETRFLVDWRLLVEERIANIGIPLDFFSFLFVVSMVFRNLNVLFFLSF